MDEVRIRGLEHIDAAGAARHRDVLLAVALPGHRLADDAGRRLELPQHLAAVGVDREELAGQRPGEDEAAGGGERAVPVRALEAELPFALAGERIDGLEEAAVL